MNTDTSRSRRFSQMLGSAARGVGSVISNAKSSVLVDVDSVDEELWALHGDAEDLDQRCEVVYLKNAKVRKSESSNVDEAGILKSVPTSPSKQVADISRSAEGQFPVMKKTPDSVIANMPESFFSADFDPVAGLITEISVWDKSHVNENFMHRIEECDTDKDLVIERLSRLVLSNYPALMACLNDVDTIRLDMSDAMSSIERSRKSLIAGQENMSVSSTHIVNLKQKISNLSRVSEIAAGLKSIKFVLENVSNNFVTGEVGKAAECVLRVLHIIRSPEFCNFRAVSDMEATIQSHAYIIRQKTDKALRRLSCRKFACADYTSIVQSYIILDFLRERFGVQLSDQSEHVRANTPEILIDSFGCLEGLHHRIQRFQTEDIVTCLRTAVQEFLYTGMQYRQRSGKTISPSKFIASGAQMLDLEEVRENINDISTPAIF